MLSLTPRPAGTFLSSDRTAPHRDTAESLLVLQLSALDAEAKDISARHGLAPPELSQPRPGDFDDEEDGGDGDAGSDVATEVAGGLQEGANEEPQEGVSSASRGPRYMARMKNLANEKRNDRVGCWGAWWRGSP